MNKAHQKLQKKHQHCESELRQIGPHIGLYCKQHNKWLKWANKQEAVIYNQLKNPS